MRKKLSDVAKRKIYVCIVANKVKMLGENSKQFGFSFMFQLCNASTESLASTVSYLKINCLFTWLIFSLKYGSEFKPSFSCFQVVVATVVDVLLCQVDFNLAY